MAKEIQLTQGKVAIIDDEDFEYLNQFKWHTVENCNNFYAKTSMKNNRGKKISMHRLLTKNINTKMHTDHINGNGLDNRKINLRICTHSENLRNRKKNVNNKSGYKGVSLDKNLNKFRCKLYMNGKAIHIGYFINPKDAARAYNDAALKYHGEFAHLNKID